MKSLIEGYWRFRARFDGERRQNYRMLADQGQTPHSMIVGCCDSRVDPHDIFDLVPGEAFVLRNVANLVPPFESGGGLHGVSAAVEYGVVHLGVRHIVVMGHEKCGGVAAAWEGHSHKESPAKDAPQTDAFISKWLSTLDPACQRVAEYVSEQQHCDPLALLEEENIRLGLQNLMSFSFVAERVRQGKLRLSGTHFSMTDGALKCLDPEKDRFVKVAPSPE